MTAPDPYPGCPTEQPRQPGGTPSGGRFAQMTRREPDVTLAHLSDEDYNADGTFEYPPIPRSVEQHVAFWSRVKVPDPIIARVRNEYVVQVNAYRDAQMDAWDDAHPVPTGVFGAKSAELAAHSEARKAAGVAVDETRPGAIPAVLARPLIRAAQMARYARWLETQEQYDEVLATEIDLGEARPWTVRDTLEAYHLDELPEGSFEDAGSYAGINMAVVAQRITDLVDLLDPSEADGQ